MTETVSNVYDLVYPSPPTLVEIAAISVAFELWREEIAKYCQSSTSTSDKFNLAKKIVLRSTIPALPSVIYKILEEYVEKSGSSIALWRDHLGEVFNYRGNILKDFHDFAYDWDGTLNYVRTAQRMMLCERFSEEQKFKIACKYCFENDIMKTWPLVSANMNLDKINFYKFPLLFYWTCSLRNEMHKLCNRNRFDIPVEAVEELMLKLLDKCGRNDWSSVEYFWNRIPNAWQSPRTWNVMVNLPEIVARFILPKQLDVCAERCYDLIMALLEENSNKACILPVWLVLRNKIDKNSFERLVVYFFIKETNNLIAKERLSPKDDAYLYCEIWKTAPPNLRQSVIRNVIANTNYTRNKLFLRNWYRPTVPREMKFLITVLLDASIEERRKFWYKNWLALFIGTGVEDFRKIMNLCFENKKQISKFKQNTIRKNENIRQYCVFLVKECSLQPVIDLLEFCYPDKKTKKEVIKRLKKHDSLDITSNIKREVLNRIKQWDEFIAGAFDDVDLNH